MTALMTARRHDGEHRPEPPRYPEAFGLVSTVLGAGKEALALEYVALAGSSRGGAGLDLSALFEGTT